MILFNYFILTVSVLLGLVAALLIGASVYLADGEEEETEELFVTAKVGFLIVTSVMVVLHTVYHFLT